MMQLSNHDLERVRGGAGETCEPDRGGAADDACYPTPDLGGWSDPLPDACYPGGYGYSGHEGAW